MIVELNKIYIMSCPPEASLLGDFVYSESPNQTYVTLKKLHNTMEPLVPVKSLSKVFKHLNKNMQVVVFYTNYPEQKVKDLIDKTIDGYAQGLQNGRELKKQRG